MRRITWSAVRPCRWVANAEADAHTGSFLCRPIRQLAGSCPARRPGRRKVDKAGRQQQRLFGCRWRHHSRCIVAADVTHAVTATTAGRAATTAVTAAADGAASARHLVAAIGPRPQHRGKAVLEPSEHRVVGQAVHTSDMRVPRAARQQLHRSFCKRKLRRLVRAAGRRLLLHTFATKDAGICATGRWGDRRHLCGRYAVAGRAPGVEHRAAHTAWSRGRRHPGRQLRTKPAGRRRQRLAAGAERHRIKHAEGVHTLIHTPVHTLFHIRAARERGAQRGGCAPQPRPLVL
mmetsp:Transcript_6659/g.20566  ORF Transcript_6659/g.20566 Transcript_6659/m.20566 type:complete len:290 (-) Transcript_6659:7-876(-)